MTTDPILETMVRYGVSRETAELALAAARMAQVLVYGEEPPRGPERENGLVTVEELDRA